jgi:hypothetical protein
LWLKYVHLLNLDPREVARRLDAYADRLEGK